MDSSDPPTEPLPSSEEPQGGLRPKLRSGLFWLGLGNFAARAVSVAVHVVLAWQLDATDYGLVAMTLALTMVFQVLSEFGVGTAVIQKKGMPESYPHTAFMLNLGASAVMAALAWVTAPWLAAFYREEAVTLLVRVCSLGFIIAALRTIPMAVLRKKLAFGPYAILDSLSHAATGILAIVFAVLGATYWSLVIPGMVVGLLMTPLWYVLASWRPRLRFEWNALRELFAYSKYVVGASLLLLLLNNAGFIIAGHLFDTGSAGIYRFAMQNGMFIVTSFAWLVGSVSLSGFAIQQGDDARLRHSFVRAYEVLLATTLPFHLLLMILAPLLFAGVFPSRWAPAVPLFRILLVYATVRAVIAHVAPFYNAINRPQVNLAFYGVVMPVAVGAMYVGCVRYQLAGLAWGASVTQAVGALAILAITPSVMKWEKIPYLRISFPYFVAGAVVAAVAKLCALVLQGWGAHPAVTFFGASAAGGVCYPVCLFFLARAQFNQLLEDILPQRLLPGRWGTADEPEDGPDQ